jgi:hypothetical protein
VVRPSLFIVVGYSYSLHGFRTVESFVFTDTDSQALKYTSPVFSGKVVETDGHIRVVGPRAVAEPRLWLVGHGDWTDYASATLIGVGRTARSTVEQVVDTLTVPGPLS